MPNNSGLLVEVCGVDGSGKSTAIQSVTSTLLTQGLNVTAIRPLVGDNDFVNLIREPIRRAGGTTWSRDGKSIDFLNGYFSHILAANAVSNIEPILKTGAIALCDRYKLSHSVNQEAFGNDMSEFEPLMTTIPDADLTVLIDVPAEVALSRIAQRSTKGVGDNAAFVTKTIDLLHHRLPQNSHVIDGTKPLDRVAKHLLRVVLQHVPEGRRS